MTTANGHQGNAGSGDSPPPLSEAELLARGWEAITAFVPIGHCSPHAAGTDGLGADRNGHGASPHAEGASPDSRGASPEGHSAGSQQKSQAAKRKGEERRLLRELGRGQLNVVTSLDPVAREAVKALAEALTDKTSMAAVAAAVTAVIGSAPLRDLVVRVDGDAEVRDCVAAMTVDAPLKALLVRVSSQPSVRAAAAAVSVNDQVAVDAVEIAVARPDAARLGLRLTDMPGLRGWLVRTLMGVRRIRRDACT